LAASCSGQEVDDICDQNHHDTVGAVAVDKFGNVAFATSTGGINAKRPGRVGDSPIIGSGGYADNETGAVSCTGHGESISKVCLAHRIITNIRNGLTPEAAAKEALDYMTLRVKGSGGVIVIDSTGNMAQHFSTSRMAWASVRGGIMQHGLNPEEVLVEKYNI